MYIQEQMATIISTALTAKCVNCTQRLLAKVEHFAHVNICLLDLDVDVPNGIHVLFYYMSPTGFTCYIVNFKLLGSYVFTPTQFIQNLQYNIPTTASGFIYDVWRY